MRPGGKAVDGDRAVGRGAGASAFAWMALLVWAGCAPGGPVEGDGRCAGDAAEASETLRHVSEVVINRNFAENRVEPFEPHIAEDITAFGPGARSLQRGKGPMMEGLRRAVRTKTTHKWEEWDWNVQVYDDVGIVTFLYEHDATREGGRASRVQRATYVFRCVDARWQLVHDHTSLRPGGES